MCSVDSSANADRAPKSRGLSDPGTPPYIAPPGAERAPRNPGCCASAPAGITPWAPQRSRYRRFCYRVRDRRWTSNETPGRSRLSAALAVCAPSSRVILPLPAGIPQDFARPAARGMLGPRPVNLVSGTAAGLGSADGSLFRVGGGRYSVPAAERPAEAAQVAEAELFGDFARAHPALEQRARGLIQGAVPQLAEAR